MTDTETIKEAREWVKERDEEDGDSSTGVGATVPSSYFRAAIDTIERLLAIIDAQEAA